LLFFRQTAADFQQRRFWAGAQNFNFAPKWVFHAGFCIFGGKSFQQEEHFPTAQNLGGQLLPSTLCHEVFFPFNTTTYEPLHLADIPFSKLAVFACLEILLCGSHPVVAIIIFFKPSVLNSRG